MSVLTQVWAATSSTFAVLHAPSAAVPDFGRGSRKKSKQREEELARAAAVAEAQRRAAAAACVQVPCVSSTPATPPSDVSDAEVVHMALLATEVLQCNRDLLHASLIFHCRTAQMFEVDEAAKAVQQVSERVDTRGGFPARLHGGALLGITFTASHTSGGREYHCRDGKQKPHGHILYPCS